jgi:hypothetical protein
MHIEMLRQLAFDRTEELRTDARRARHLRELRALRAAESDQDRSWREWRGLLHALTAR